MSLNAEPKWSEIPELTTSTLAVGGSGGAMNAQAQALAERIAFLKQFCDKLQLTLEGLGGPTAKLKYVSEAMGVTAPPTSLGSQELFMNEKTNTIYYGKGNRGNGQAQTILELLSGAKIAALASIQEDMSTFQEAFAVVQQTVENSTSTVADIEAQMGTFSASFTALQASVAQALADAQALLDQVTGAIVSDRIEEITEGLGVFALATLLTIGASTFPKLKISTGSGYEVVIETVDGEAVDLRLQSVGNVEVFAGTEGDRIINMHGDARFLRKLSLVDFGNTTPEAGDLWTADDQLLFYSAYSSKFFDLMTDLTVPVQNRGEATIPRYTPVLVKGSAGIFTIEPLHPSTFPEDGLIGFTSSNINPNARGVVVLRGYLTAMNTSAYAAGAKLYSSGAGTMGTTPVSSPAPRIHLGTVLESADSSGVFYVNPVVLDRLPRVPYVDMFKSSATTVPAASVSVGGFSVSKDNCGAANGPNGTFTCPIAGLLQVEWEIDFPSDATDTWSTCTLNGSTKASAPSHTFSGRIRFRGNTVMEVAAGEVVRINAYASNNVTIFANGSARFYYVGRA